MEYLYQLLSQITTNPEAMRLLFVICIFITVLIIMGSIISLGFGLADPVSRRLKSVRSNHVKEPGWSVGSVAQFLKPVAAYVTPRESEELNKIANKLVVAGFRSPHAVLIFYSIKSLLVIIVSLITVFIGFTSLGWPNKNMFFILGGAAFTASVLPNYILRHLTTKRQRALRIGFPDALDLLVVCSEAGLGLNSAFARVAEELYASHPTLAEELALVNVEIQSGVDRTIALKNLAERTGLDDIAGLVTSLSQSARFGTSIAATLRVYSDDLRDKRKQAAEEKAAKLGTKMIFPLVFCLWPGFFAVAVGPAAIALVKAFSNMSQ